MFPGKETRGDLEGDGTKVLASVNRNEFKDTQHRRKGGRRIPRITYDIGYRTVL